MKPLVAISSCLLGEAVRYDGKSKRQDWIDELAEKLDFLPLCPEVGAGLGVPRAPVQLTDTQDGIRAVGVDDPTLDVTQAIIEYANEICPELLNISGLILKARSPSCGLDSTPVFNLSGIQGDVSSGLFASFLRDQWPSAPMVDEEYLSLATNRIRFIDAASRFIDLDS